MTRCARVVISAALAACSSSTPTERERALAQLPPEAQLVAAADGVALGSFRAVVDVVRRHIPSRLDCVVDAALTSEAVALSFDPKIGTTIVIVTRAHVAQCPALSQIAGDTFVATIGAGSVASSPAASLFASPRWSRARPYLLRDPVAIAIERGGRRFLAVAQPKPLDAWLSIDALDIATTQREVGEWLGVHRSMPFASKLDVQQRGNQLLVHVDKLALDDLVTITGELLRASDVAPVATAPAFTCPPPGNGITSCSDGTRYVVPSVGGTLRKLIAVDALPVIAGGDVIGIRLTDDAEILLRRGDIILGLDSHRITSSAQLLDLARHVGGRAALAIRRDGSDVVLELSE